LAKKCWPSEDRLVGICVLAVLNNVLSKANRRLAILRGIDQDLSNSEIAEEMGVTIRTIKRDLMKMKYNRDPKLIQAYREKKIRKQSLIKKPARIRNIRFKNMTGMTFQEKNFENMISFYRSELIKILKSKNENTEIMFLPKNVQRTLKRNEIIDGNRRMRKISSKAREYLSHSSRDTK
jgi:hypothetical protein